MFDPKSVRFRGPLVPHVERFWAELLREGYAQLSGANLLRVAAHVSRWLDDRGLSAGDLTEKRIAQFAAHRRRQGYTQFLTPRAVEPLLKYLRMVGVAPPPEVAPETPVDRIVREYREYLAAERGLATITIFHYTRFARHYIAAEFDTRAPDWHGLDAGDVLRFIAREFRQSSVGTCKLTVTMLRSFLRYLHVRGAIAHDLAECVPAVAGWRLSSLPKGLEAEQVKRLLASCDSRSLAGIRNLAVLHLLARLGLRAGEVAALTLDDIDWRSGEIVVRGKPRRESRLPLPSDVGKAIVAYLRRRPRVASRALFLGVTAPNRRLTAHRVSSLTGEALRAIGVSTGGAHVLRHTAATQMLRRGATLGEVGHVLRHRHLDTTAIYAKVDHAALRTLVQPWPGGVA